MNDVLCVHFIEKVHVVRAPEFSVGLGDRFAARLVFQDYGSGDRFPLCSTIEDATASQQQDQGPEQ